MAPPSARGRRLAWEAAEPGRLLLDLFGRAAELCLARDGGVRFRAAGGARLPPDPTPHLGRREPPLAPAEPFEVEGGGVAMAFEGPEGAAEVELFPEPLSLRLRSRRGEPVAELRRLTVAEAGGGRVEVVLPPESRVLGPGPRTDRPRTRGSRVRLGSRARPLGPGPGPFSVSAAGLLVLSPEARRVRAGGLFFDLFGESRFEIGFGGPDRVEVSFAHGILDLLVLPGPEPLAVLRRLAARIGPPCCPPAAALAPRLRLARRPGGRALARLGDRLAALDLPIGGLHVPAAAGSEAPPPGRVAGSEGVPAVRSCDVHPFLPLRGGSGRVEPPVCLDPRGLPARGVDRTGPCLLPDLSQPAARAALGRALVGREVGEGHRPPDLHLVGAEPRARRFGLVLGPLAVPLGGHLLSGVTARPPFAEGPVPFEAIRRLYALDAARAVREALDLTEGGSERLLTAACGMPDSTRYAALVLRTRGSGYRDLRAGVRALLSLACAGMAPCSLEVGGSRGRPSGELFLRWLEAVLLQPLVWLPLPPGLRARARPRSTPGAVLRRVRDLLRLRQHLLPTLRGALLHASRTGEPPWRPPVLDFPEDPGCREAEDHVLVGGRLLTALVLEPGVREREVQVPPGTWIDFHDDSIHRGPRSVRLAAPPGRPVLLVRAGSALAVRGVQAPGDAAAPATRLEVFPAGDGVGEIWPVSPAEPAPLPRRIAIYGRAAGRLRIEVGAVAGGVPQAPILHLRIRSAPRPLAVRLDAGRLPEGGAPPCWRHAEGRLEIRVPDTGRGCLLEVEPAP